MLAMMVLAAALEDGRLPERWTPAAPEPADAPAFLVHEYNPDFVILRQSGRTNFEKPFVYLLFGNDKVLLVDTGAEGADVTPEVKRLLAAWGARHGGRTPALIVVHSHGHSDHTAGDAALKAIPGTTVVDGNPDAVQKFFGFQRWPDDVVTCDLGGRVLDIMAIPGHQAASIAIYDRRTGILLTGDTVYAGRLYVRDAAAFRASVKRLVDFTRDHPVAHVLGAHIENTRTPFVDYPEGTTFQPDEHALELGRAHLLELDEALATMGATLERRALRDLTIYPVP